MTAIKIEFLFARESRLVSIDSIEKLTFDHLIELVVESFPKCKYPFKSFAYIDDDGDRITVSSELEMEPLRGFYSRLSEEQTTEKAVLQLQPIVNRNRTNLTISTAEEQVNVDIDDIFDSVTSFDLEPFELIGSGNGGIVRRCFDRRNDRILAVKIISLDYQKEEKKQEILTELNALKMLNSDFIVEFYGVFLDRNSVHICTELMDRGSLEAYVGLMFPEKVLRQIASAMIQGLNVMWKQKIMHRDLKPSNVLLNSFGSIKLCDFGVSRVLETIGQKLQTFVGTQKYMAPERILSNQYNVSSEIWSFGMTILEVGLGKFPFEIESNVQTRPIDFVERILFRNAPVLSDVRSFSEQFSKFIEKCLAKNPADRPSPNEFSSFSTEFDPEIVSQFFNQHFSSTNFFSAQKP